MPIFTKPSPVITSGLTFPESLIYTIMHIKQSLFLTLSSRFETRRSLQDTDKTGGVGRHRKENEAEMSWVHFAQG